jgi:hypothetical protein
MKHRGRKKIFCIICCLCVAGETTVEQIAADHDTCSAFSGLAVDGGDVAVVLRQPGVNIFTEWTDVREVWRVVVVKGIALKVQKSNWCGFTLSFVHTGEVRSAKTQAVIFKVVAMVLT